MFYETQNILLKIRQHYASLTQDEITDAHADLNEFKTFLKHEISALGKLLKRETRFSLQANQEDHDSANSI